VNARTLTHAEFLAEATNLFGDDPKTYAFKCPNCGDVATIADFIDVGEPGRAGQDCIGRHLGRNPERGCDWVAYGLIPGPWTVVMPDGHEVRSFPFAATETTS
jgi:hypothetical protein